MRKIFSALAILCAVSLNARQISYRDMSIIVTVPARTAIALKFEEKEQHDSDIKKAYSCAITRHDNIRKSFRADRIFDKPLVLEGGYISDNRYTISFYSDDREKIDARIMTSCVPLKKVPERVYRIKHVLTEIETMMVEWGVLLCVTLLAKKSWEYIGNADNRELKRAFHDPAYHDVMVANDKAKRNGEENIKNGKPTLEDIKSENKKPKNNKKVRFGPDCEVCLF